MAFTKNVSQQFCDEQQRVLKSLVGDLEERLHALSIFDRVSEINALADDLEGQVLLAFDSAHKHLVEQRNRQLDSIRIYRGTQNKPPFASSHIDNQDEFICFQLKKSRTHAVRTSLDESSPEAEIKALKSSIDSLEPGEMVSAQSEIDTIKERSNEAGFNDVKFKPNHLYSLEFTQIGRIDLSSSYETESNAASKMIDLMLKFSHRSEFKVLEKFFLYHPNNRLVSFSDANRFRCWDPYKKQILWEFESNKGLIYAMILLTSVFMATGHEKGRIWIWDGRKLRPIKKLKGQRNSKVHALVALPNGKLASAADQDHRIIIWDPFLEKSSCRLLTLRQGSQGSTVSSIGLLSNGFLVSQSTGPDKSVIEIWNTMNGELVQQLDIAHTKMLPLVVLSNDQVAFASHCGDVRVYDVVEKSLVSSWVFDEPNLREIWSMQRLRGDRLILTCASEIRSSLKIVDSSKGQLIQTIPTNIMIDKFYIFVFPFSDTLVATHGQGFFEVWNYVDCDSE